MIPLTRLNHQELILNCDLIKFIEHVQDTVITLVNGEKLTVKEQPEEILRRIGQYRREQAALGTGRSPASAVEVGLGPELAREAWSWPP